jgi:hypothetical protein
MFGIVHPNTYYCALVVFNVVGIGLLRHTRALLGHTHERGRTLAR